MPGEEGGTPYYGDPDYILQVTGIRPDELGLKGEGEPSPEEQLYAFVEKWLTQAKDHIDTDRGQDFGEEPPAGIEQIAERIVINMIGYLKQRRVSGIVRVGEYNVQLVQDTIITRAIREDLARFPRVTSKADYVFGMAVVSGEDSEDDEDDD